MKKELQELRLKQTLGKLESYLKSEAAGSLTQQQINQIGQLTDDELLENYEKEKELEEELNTMIANLDNLKLSQ